MSSAAGQVFTPDGELVGYSVYHGTSDVMHPGINREFTWDEPGWDRQADCDHDGEVCIIVSDYGGGFYWAGLYCPECLVIIGPLSPYGEEYGYTIPKNGPDPGPEQFDGHPFPELNRHDLVVPDGR